MVKINRFGAFMRRYGLKIYFFPYVAFFMKMYTSYLVQDISHLPEPPTYAWHQTIWIWIFRINGLLIVIPAGAFLATYFLAKFPEVHEGPDTDAKPGVIVSTKTTKNGLLENGYTNGIKNGIHKNGYKNGVTNGIHKNGDLNGVKNGIHKNGILNGVKNGKNGYKNGVTLGSAYDHLSCFVIRIVTRGDYPELIKRNVAFHIHLIEKYCHCDRLEAHIVTEKPLGGDYKVGETGYAREILVPSDYKPENGTLAKARNMAYWTEVLSKDWEYPPDDQTWILTLDEDAFITDGFMSEFLHKFLPSGAHCSVSPTLLELPATAGFGNGCEESFFVTLQAMGMWLEGAVLKRTPLWFRGAAYVIRRDVDKEIGHDYQPELSVTEDHVFGHFFSDTRYKIGYINGWNWEGGAPDLLGLIKQRGRWFRGHMYAFLYQKMSPERRLFCAIRLILMYLIQGPLMASAVWGSIFLFTGNLHLIAPAAACSWPLDYVTSFAFATFFYANVFGAWHIMSTRAAIVYTIASTFWVGTVATLGVHLVELLWTLVTLADDFYHRRQRYEVTEKKES